MGNPATNLAGIYSDINPPLVINGTGSIATNFLDAGALDNAPARFYRIRSSH